VKSPHINWPDSIDEHVFLQHYWQQKPLLLKQAFTSFDNPLDSNELAGLACDADANSRFMQRVEGDEWRMCIGPLSEDFFDNISGNEWSLLVSDVEKLLPDFRAYLEPFRFLPDWRIDDLMISYAPVGGSVGAHVDQYDVFLLQADGVREWRIENTPRVGHQPSVSSSISLLGDFKADTTLRLEPGDMLYLPPAFAHHGIAVEEPCMTWSVGFRAPSAEEMLPSILGYMSEATSTATSLTCRFTDSGRTKALNPGDISSTDISQLRAMVRNALTMDDALLDLCIGRYLTESSVGDNDEPAEPIDWPAIEKQLNDDSVLLCNSQIKFATIADTDISTNEGAPDDSTSTSQSCVTLLVGGSVYGCSAHLGTRLGNNRICKASDVRTEQDRNTVVTLVNREHLLLEQRRDH